MADLLAREGLADRVHVDSAGTGDWHVGGPPDQRAVAAAARRGIVLTSVARQVTPRDLEDADVVLAMDARNLRDLQALAPSDEARAKVRLLRTFDPEAVGTGALDVPDPYLGDGDGFAAVLGQIQAACAGLLEDLRPRLTEDGA
jgi:protein-tyrosine phosphatase